MKLFRQSRSRLRTVSVLGVGTLSLALAVCSGASLSGASTPAASTAKGTPIGIGMPNLQGSTQGINFPEASVGAQAAVDWINSHGGVQGHPIKLTVCDLLTTPASDVSCANSLAAAKPVAITAGAVDNGDPIVTQAAAAGIPYTVVTGTSPQETTSPDSFVFGGSFPGSAYIIAKNEKQHGGKQVVLTLPAAPGAASTIESSVGPYFAKAGIKVKVIVTSPDGQPDMTPTIQAATASPTSGVGMLDDQTTCIAGLNAKGTLDVSSSVRFYLDAPCEANSTVKAVGSNINGVYFFDTNDATNHSDPDFATYKAAMAKYAPRTDLLGYSAYGFTVEMDLYRAMETIPKGTAITAASVKSALKNAKNVKIFLGDGLTYTCNHTAVAGIPDLCSSAFFLNQYKNGGFHFIESTTIPK
jgi:branched-chain amino acid transport system substrate-binding protein